jgi:hypothetical protein
MRKVRGGAYTERSRITFAVTNAHTARVVPSKWTLFVQTAEANLCGGRVAKSRLVPAHPLLTLNSKSEKAFVADGAHIDQRTMHAGGQEFPAETG